MPPRRGIAAVKKPSKHIYIDSDGDEVAPSVPRLACTKSTPSKGHAHKIETTSAQLRMNDSGSASSGSWSDQENADPAALRQCKWPKQPRQDSLKPDQPDQPDQQDQQDDGSSTARFPPDNKPDLSKLSPNPAGHDSVHASRPTPLSLPVRQQTSLTSTTRPSIADNMSIPGGAFVPPNQHRNLRACMVCSIVRTYNQFMQGGCPNCEDILELANNSDSINECTSQVFDGLISVADTSRSWVARFQRLEGYVPGVYATQVEGILPEEVISAVEHAGINYVPRDGSEAEMLPKD
jgi:transcription elongation factor SPT4